MTERTTQQPIPARSLSLTYWQETMRDFRRQKMAMAALAVVFLVATVGVFCPLIANSRPHYIKMVWDDHYDEAYFIVIDLAERLLVYQPGEGAKDRASIEKAMTRALGEMKRSLDHEHAADLAAAAGVFQQLARNPAAANADAIRAQLEHFEERFDLAEVALVPYAKFPAVRSLTRNEVFFIFLYLFAVSLWFVRHRFRRTSLLLAVIVLPAIVCTAVWMKFFPQVQDTFPYRLYWESEEFAQNADWKVVRAIVPFGENENLTAENRQPPTFLLPKDKHVENQHFHLLGTDTNGRDVLARMIYGARISMMIGIVAVSLYVSIGIVLGALAGYFGGWPDLLLSRLIEIVICFPVLFLILAVQTFRNASILNIMVMLGLVGWTGVARLQRGEFLRLVNLDFVQAVRGLGGSSARIIFRHILPNALGPILVLASFGMAGSILVESALSFLGFGVPQPTASWGDLLNNGRNDIQGTWWLTLFPGLAIFLTVTCFNLIGEGVRDALDPRRQH